MSTKDSSPPHLTIGWTLETAINKLTATQLSFLSARLWQANDKAAAKQIGISPSTVYNWSSDEKSAIRWLQAHYTTSAIQTSQAILTRALLRATMEKVSALDSDQLITRQNAATEIMDRVLGRPRYAVELTTNQPLLKSYVNVSPDMWDDDSPQSPDPQGDEPQQ